LGARIEYNESVQFICSGWQREWNWNWEFCPRLFNSTDSFANRTIFIIEYWCRESAWYGHRVGRLVDSVDNTPIRRLNVISCLWTNYFYSLHCVSTRRWMCALVTTKISRSPYTLQDSDNSMLCTVHHSLSKRLLYYSDFTLVTSPQTSSLTSLARFLLRTLRKMPLKTVSIGRNIPTRL